MPPPTAIAASLLGRFSNASHRPITGRAPEFTCCAASSHSPHTHTLGWLTDAEIQQAVGLQQQLHARILPGPFTVLWFHIYCVISYRNYDAWLNFTADKCRWDNAASLPRFAGGIYGKWIWGVLVCSWTLWLIHFPVILYHINTSDL